MHTRDIACNFAKCLPILKILSLANVTANIPLYLKSIVTLSTDLLLITIPVSDYCYFSDFNTSHGSVATCLMCGRTFNDNVSRNLPVSLSVNEI